MKRTALLLLLLSLAACGDPGAGPDVPDVSADVDVPEADAEADFDDHTLPGFDTVEGLLAYAGSEQSPAQVKFIVPDVRGAVGVVHYEEPGFYDLHDEWAWFRLLNGHDVPGLGLVPRNLGRTFATVAEIIAWAKKQPPTSLPAGLQWTKDGRLYLKRFYDRAFGPLRTFGLGSVLHYPPNPARVLPDEVWAFELEYTDFGPGGEDTTTLKGFLIAALKRLEAPPMVEAFFRRLEATLPPEVAPKLVWLTRSTWQHEIVAVMKADGSPYADRVVTYADLVVPGETEVYNPGVTAGRVRVVQPGEFAGAALDENTLVVLAEVPDDLPPVAGIVTSVPQTPLAHIGLLARSRGTPNVYVGGATTDQRFDTWDYYGKKVAMRATAEGVDFRELSDDEWTEYLKLKITPSLAVPMADLASTPLWVSFDGLGLSDMAERVPLIGGKAAGFMALAGQGFEVPDGVMALTVKAYAQHLAALPFAPADLLADPKFQGDARVRFLALEGEPAFRDEFAALPEDVTWLEGFLTDLADGTIVSPILQQVLALGGVQRAIEDQPVAPATLAAIEGQLAAHFAFLAPTEGLRFRSSSTAEDVEGFNGAGLYDSNTGYLHPELQPDPDDREKTIAHALKKTWASYWLAGAFEERRAAGIAHLSGRMGAAVHPVFDDADELANGVITLELVRRPDGDVTLLTVNVQQGSLSVTNPPPGSDAAPEIDTVRREGEAAALLTRVQPSTEGMPGQVLLSDAELYDLHERLSALAQLWLDTRNARYPASKQDSTLTLDLEIKRMAQGWPERADDTLTPQRLVWKQVRTLHDPVRAPADVQAMPVPRDVLGRTVRVVKHTCQGADLTLLTAECYTDAQRPWPFDFGASPFTAYVNLQLTTRPDWLPVPEGVALSVLHTAATITHPGMADGGPWTLDVQVTPPTKVGFDRLTLDAAGGWTMQVAGTPYGGAGITCTTTTPMLSPQAYLEGLFE